MDSYVCRVATLEELLKRWDYLIAIHHGSAAWRGYRALALRNYRAGSAISYLGFLNGESISEATAYVAQSAFAGDLSDPSGLLSERRAYLAAFRTNREYEGQGYFGRLYRYMESDLRQRGYSELCLGVGPEDVRDMEIYFHLGFREYMKTTVEAAPVGDGDDSARPEVILFYKKRI